MRIKFLCKYAQHIPIFSRSSIYLLLEFTCPNRLILTFEIIRSHRMHDIVNSRVRHLKTFVSSYVVLCRSCLRKSKIRNRFIQGTKCPFDIVFGFANTIACTEMCSTSCWNDSLLNFLIKVKYSQKYHF